MKNQFDTPIRQTAIIVGVTAVLIVILGSGDGIASGVGTLFHLILFVIGLPIGIGIAVAAMVGIFFAAVAMKDRNLAVSFWQGFKESCASFCSCCCACGK